MAVKTVKAPTILVFTWAKDINSIRSAAERMATSPVSPIPERKTVIKAASIGYVFNNSADRKPTILMSG